MAFTLNDARKIKGWETASDDELYQAAKTAGIEFDPMPETNIVSDYVVAPIVKGISDIGSAVGYGLGAVGLGQAANALQSSNERVQRQATSLQSPEAQADANKTLINDEGGYGGYNLGTLAQDVFGSAPGMLAMALPGAGIAGAAEKGSKALGIGARVADTLGKVASSGPLGKATAAGLDKAIGSSIGFGAAEGAYSGASNASQIQTEIRNKPLQELSANNPAFWDAYDNETDQNANEIQRGYQAREILARKAADEVFANTLVKTGAISMATGGGLFGALRGGAAAPAGSVFQKAVKTMGLEGGQEAVQSGLEQQTTNQALKDYADQDQDVNQGVLDAAARGGIAGAVMGSLGGFSSDSAQSAPQPEPQQPDQPQDKQPLALPELIFTADGSSLNKADVLRGFIQNGATEEQANDYLKQITALPQEQRTEVNLDPYRFLQERDAQTMREYGDDPEAVNERIAIKGEENIVDPGYDENAPFEIDLKNPKAWEDSVSWDEADLLNEPKQTEQPNQEIRKRLLQSQPVSTQTEPVPPAQSQLSPEIANADNSSGAVIENNSRATSGNQGATEPSGNTGAVASTGFGSQFSGGTANVQPELQGQESTNADVDRRALDPILTTPKSAYVISELKARKIKKDSPGFKQARSAIEADYEQKLDQALANAPFEVYASHPSNANVPSQDLLRQGYNKLQQDLKNAENQTQPVLPNTSTDTSGNVAPTDSNPQQPAVPAQEVTASNGQPFKNIGGAKLTQKRQGLTESHNVVLVDGGYVLRPKQVAQSRQATANQGNTQPAEIKALSQNSELQLNKKQHPWQLTRKEWNKQRIDISPDSVQSKFTKNTASEMIAKNEKLQWLLFNVSSEASNKLKSAAKKEIKLTKEEVDDLLERVNTPVDHKDVIEKALKEGLPVPQEVLNEYQDLKAQQNDQSQNTAAQTAETQEEINATAEKPSTVSDNQANQEISQPKSVPSNEAPAENVKQDKENGKTEQQDQSVDQEKKSTYQRLYGISKRLGLIVDSGLMQFKSGGGKIRIPADDQYAIGADVNTIFAHEIGHAVMQKRGISYQGFPVSELKKQISNWHELKQASKEYRPNIWGSKNKKILTHVNKPDEIIADAIASVLIGKNDFSLLKGLPLEKHDLGLDMLYPGGDYPGASVAKTDTQKEINVTAEKLNTVSNNDEGLQKPQPAVKNNVIGKGSTGDVIQVGNEAVKKSTGLEAEIYKKLSSINGIANGYEKDGKIHTPIYKQVISVDDIEVNKRVLLAPLISKNVTRINNAISSLINAGYDYNDPLQFGLTQDGQLDLIDFSNAQKEIGRDLISNNLMFLSQFYKQFGLNRQSNAVSEVREVLLNQHLHVKMNGNPLLGDKYDGVNYKEISDRINNKPAGNVYYTTNARYVQLKGVAQTDNIGPEKVKVVFSDLPLSQKDVAAWELTPVLTGYKTAQSKTPEAQEEISVTAEKLSTVSNNKENLQKEVNPELTALFKKLGKKQISADSKLLEGVENADKIAVVQNNWLDILEDHAYEADKDNGIKGKKSQSIIMNGC